MSRDDNNRILDSDIIRIANRNKAILKLLVELLHNSNWDDEKIEKIMSEYIDPIRTMISKEDNESMQIKIIEWRRDYLNKVWNDVWNYQKDDSVIDRAKIFLSQNEKLT